MSNLSNGFVYLDQVAPSILQNIVYAGEQNFIGRKIDGYIQGRAILSEQAAKALVNVQEEIQNDGYSLLVYDAYRPQKAVDQFMRWSSDANDTKMRELYYPYVAKSELVELGYIVRRSAHSRGSTVDVTLVVSGQNVAKTPDIIKRKLKCGREFHHLYDGSVDMSSSFDLFDEVSSHNSKLILPESAKYRAYLSDKMQKHGFARYDKEWWHYTLRAEPFPDTYFNFNT